MLDKNTIGLILPLSFNQFRCKSTIELMLPCSIEQFRGQLAAKMGRFRFGLRPVIGTLCGTRLTVWKNGWFRRNGTQARLSAELIDYGKKTRISGNFSMPPFTVAFWAILLAGFGIVFGAVFVRSLIAVISDIINDRSGGGGSVWRDLVVSPIGMLYVVGFHAYERWVAREQQAFLIDFLRTVGADASRAAHPIASDITRHMRES